MPQSETLVLTWVWSLGSNSLTFHLVACIPIQTFGFVLYGGEKEPTRFMGFVGHLGAQWLSVYLWLRLWSRGPGIKSHIELPTGSLLLPLPVSLPLSLCVSHEWINKIFFKKKKKKSFLTHNDRNLHFSSRTPPVAFWNFVTVKLFISLPFVKIFCFCKWLANHTNSLIFSFTNSIYKQ